MDWSRRACSNRCSATTRPSRQPPRKALREALALEQPTVADSARVLHAAVELLAAAAEHEPLLLRVDDVQWLDPSSRQAIAFIVRRAARSRHRRDHRVVAARRGRSSPGPAFRS